MEVQIRSLSPVFSLCVCVCTASCIASLYTSSFSSYNKKKVSVTFIKKKQKYESTRSAGGQKENAILTYVSSNSATWMRQS